MSGDDSVKMNDQIDGFNGGIEEDGNICFHVTTSDGTDLQVLKLEANGDIYVHGRKADSDREVVEALKEFLKMALFPGTTGELVRDPGFEIIRRLQQRVRELEAQLPEQS